MIMFSSSTRRDFLSLDFSIEIFLESSLHLYLTNSHFVMGSSKDEAFSKKFGIAFFIASTNSLSCINELLNFNCLDLLPHSERYRTSILEQNDLIAQTELLTKSLTKMHLARILENKDRIKAKSNAYARSLLHSFSVHVC